MVKTPGREVQFEVHQNVLRKFITRHDRVLEIEAGRFTQVLDRIGCRTFVADISEVQLKLNRENAMAHGFSKAIEDWRQVDICDLSEFESNSFDSVVAIGGPLSYVLDRSSQALSECIRVVRPGGVVILGVMSLWGTIHSYLEGVLGYPSDDNAQIIESGDLIQSNSQMATHYCHLFRSTELRAFLESQDLIVEYVSALSSLSNVHGGSQDTIRTNPTKWNDLIKMEILASQEPGYMDGGTNLIAVGRKQNVPENSL